MDGKLANEIRYINGLKQADAEAKRTARRNRPWYLYPAAGQLVKKTCKLGRWHKRPLSSFAPGPGEYGRQPFCLDCAPPPRKVERKARQRPRVEYTMVKAATWAEILRPQSRRAPPQPSKQSWSVEYERTYNKAYAAKYKARTARARAIRRGKLTADDWYYILELYDNRCIYCGARGDLQQDHLMPIARGGRHEAANVAPACRRCNSFKRAKASKDLPANYQAAIQRHAEILS